MGLTHPPIDRVVGILGGSFDPVHWAHLAMADAFATALELDEIRFLPAARPWQKVHRLASPADRHAMLDAALAAHRPARGTYRVDARELAREGATYTVDTLADIRAEVGDRTSLVFLIGADQLVHLDTWKDWRGLWRDAHLAAVTRPGFAIDRLPADVASEWSSRLTDAAGLRAVPSGHAHLLEGLALDVSATAIRTLLAAADPPDAAALARLVPLPVLDYIRANHLYRS